MAIEKFFSSFANLKYTKGYINFIISPDKLNVLFLQKKDGIWKIVEKQEFNGSLILKDGVNIDFIRKALSQLNISNIEVGISLNTPFFFTNVIKIPNIEGSVKNALGMKIQTEFPLPIEKYIWSFEELPSFDSQRTFLVFFYNRNVLESINKAFTFNGILPVVIEPAIYSVLRYLKEKFTLEVEKTYFIMILYASVLTGFIYENGIIKNTFSESINDSTNISKSLEKFIQFTLQKFSVERIKREIGGLILISDKTMDIELDFDVMQIHDILKMSPDSIIGIGLNERVSKAPVSDNEILLNTVNPTTEFLYLKLSRYLNFWLTIVLGVGILSISSLYAYSLNLSIINKNLQIDAVATKSDISIYKDNLKEILLLVKKSDMSKNIPYETFSKIIEVEKIMTIKNSILGTRTLTINGIVGIKNFEKLRTLIFKISQNAEIREIRATANEIEVEINVNL